MLEKMKEIIAEQLNVDPEEITEATSFKDDLEEEYQTEIPSDDLQDLTTVGQVMDYLKAHGVEA